MVDAIATAWDQLTCWWDHYIGVVGTHAERLFGVMHQSGLATGRGAILAFVAVALLVLFALILPSRRRDGGSLSGLTRRSRLRGIAAVLVLLVIFSFWASAADLASAVLAQGVVSPDGYRKTVQHLEGGIIRTIHVREGVVVADGDTLITVDDTQAQVELRELRERYARLLAQEARLQTELSGGDSMSFPTALADMTDVNVARIMEGERKLLQSRRATQQGREQILDQRIKQLEEEIVGLRDVIAAQERQLALISQEISGVQTLYEKGLEKIARLLALRRTQAQIEAERASNRANIARNDQKIGETRMQLLTTREQLMEQVSGDLIKVTTELAELRSKIASREDVLQRTAIRAPVSGVVMNVRVTTQTGVIKPGEPLLDIVPTDARLIINAQVKATDIDDVHPGMDARVLLTAYRQRALPQIHGVVQSISADRLIDDRSGFPYYLAKVEVDAADLHRLQGVSLIPGMPAEVMILGSERTLIDYMLRPLTESLTKSFRES